MSNTSFYGGRPGKSFAISHVFPNMEAMMEDLRAGYSSSIGFNEYVMINYGQKAIEIEGNKVVDQDNGHSLYNNTLWEKVYLEEAEEKKESESKAKDLIRIDGSNICYKNIARFTVTLPMINADLTLTDPKNTEASMVVEVDENNPEQLTFAFDIPRAARFYEGKENPNIDAETKKGLINNIEGYAEGDYYLSTSTG